jgi:hypothetical protein
MKASFASMVGRRCWSTWSFRIRRSGQGKRDASIASTPWRPDAVSGSHPHYLLSHSIARKLPVRSQPIPKSKGMTGTHAVETVEPALARQALAKNMGRLTCVFFKTRRADMCDVTVRTNQNDRSLGRGEFGSVGTP